MAMAVEFGLEVAISLGQRSIELKSNAINIVRTIRNMVLGRSQTHLIFKDILDLTKNLDFFSVDHVK